MTPGDARRVAAQLQDRYPGADIRVTARLGGLSLIIRTSDGSTVQAETGDGPSPILAVLGVHP